VVDPVWRDIDVAVDECQQNAARDRHTIMAGRSCNGSARQLKSPAIWDSALGPRARIVHSRMNNNDLEPVSSPLRSECGQASSNRPRRVERRHNPRHLWRDRIGLVRNQWR